MYANMVNAPAVLSTYARLPGLIERYGRQMGVKPGRLRVWELMNRWASCSQAGNLNFHWRALALPLDILEYLVVHELAHLLHRNHTKDFWSTVDKAYLHGYALSRSKSG